MWGESVRQKHFRGSGAETPDFAVWRGVSVRDVLRYLEEDHEYVVGNRKRHKDSSGEVRSMFDQFLGELRTNGIRVSTPEWMHFLTVLRIRARGDFFQNVVNPGDFFEQIRGYARVTLIKNKQDEALFHKIFDRFFLNIAKVIVHEVDGRQEEMADENQSGEENDDTEVENNNPSSEMSDAKKQHDDQDMREDQEPISPKWHSGEEQLHDVAADQYNQLLHETDKENVGKKDAKQGDEGGGETGTGDEGRGRGNDGEEGMGNDKNNLPRNTGVLHEKKGAPAKGDDNGAQGSGRGKEQGEEPAFQELSEYRGRGKGNSRYSIPPTVFDDHMPSRQRTIERKITMDQYDGGQRYERRPTRADVKQIVQNLRTIILAASKVSGKDVHVSRTVDNFAQKDFRIEFTRERQKQPDVVLFVDTGGPVDEWAPIIREVMEGMAKGLTKLKVYLFHNNLYGYVWEIDQNNLTQDEPRPLRNIRTLITHKSKVIIYGDAEMADFELKKDAYASRLNQDDVRAFTMSGDDCLRWIVKKSGKAVWVNPIFRKDWEKNRHRSGTIFTVGNIVPMFDLSAGGLEDAVKELIKN